MKATKGFTLIELLIVISIIGVLVTLGIASSGAIQNMARRRAAESTIKSLEAALSMYKTSYGIYPNDESAKSVMNDLTGYKSSPDQPDALYLDDATWNGPYFTADAKEFEEGKRNMALLDPWSSPYRFNLSDPKHNPFSCDIWSLGENREDEGGQGDDLKNW